jgi:hypothetical protein
MSKLVKALGFIYILCLTFNQANAMTVRAEASPLLMPGIIETGVPFTVDIYMNNNDTIYGIPNEHGYRIGMSLPFSFFSPDGSIHNVEHINAGGYPARNVEFLNGFSDFWNIFFTAFLWSYDGSLPDSLDFVGIASPGINGGWPFNLGELLYIQFHFQINETGMFCIDSIEGRAPEYDWLFDDPSPSFNGPYCWAAINPDHKAIIFPDLMPAIYAHTYDSVFANIDIYILGGAHSVLDINTSTVIVNESVIPVSFEYLPADSIGEALRIKILTREFLPSYLPAWDTSMQYYSVKGQFTDGTDFSIYNWFKLVGHRSGDANKDGNIDIFDISFMISYLYLGGSAPNPENIGDIDGDCYINVFDITYLINYLYNEGAPPLHGCE